MVEELLRVFGTFSLFVLVIVGLLIIIFIGILLFVAAIKIILFICDKVNNFLYKHLSRGNN